MRLYIDCDGVLTDGKLTIDRHGEKMFKRFHTRDVRAIRELVAHGWEVTIISADDWPGLHFFADKVGADVLIDDQKNGLLPGYVAVGDDAWDVQLLQRADRAYAPADADSSVLGLPHVRSLRARGGQGVVAELVRELLG